MRLQTLGRIERLEGLKVNLVRTAQGQLALLQELPAGRIPVRAAALPNILNQWQVNGKTYLLLEREQGIGLDQCERDLLHASQLEQVARLRQQYGARLPLSMFLLRQDGQVRLRYLPSLEVPVQRCSVVVSKPPSPSLWTRLLAVTRFWMGAWAVVAVR